ncbi:MAG: nucleoside-diphosphate kinase [Candidatus Pacebacteria bacterium]|nr:nucleoside-diphosphate kinase [Candidatus Paceibacterota bacterium]
MVKKLKEEKTLILIKPDGVKRGLVGEVIKRIEQRGLKIVGLQMFQATAKDISKHYSTAEANLKRMGEKAVAGYQKFGMDPKKELGTDDPLKAGKMVHSWLVEYFTSAPIIKMVIQGVQAVEMVRKLVGDTMPAKAEMGTIRGDFSVDSSVLANSQKRAVRNIVHASGEIEEAKEEILLWFKPEEIHEYKRAEEDIMF